MVIALCALAASCVDIFVRVGSEYCCLASSSLLLNTASRDNNVAFSVGFVVAHELMN